MDARERKRLIDLYRDGYRVVTEALEGITDGELDHSATDDWTPRQIAHHLADSEMESAGRIRRLLAMQEKKVYGYDEKAFASLSSDRPIGPSIEAMRYARETTAQIMERMTEGKFRHLPVVDQGKLVGVISIGDVVKYRVGEIEGESNALREYIATA